MDTETPKTDAAVEKSLTDNGGAYLTEALLMHARELERKWDSDRRIFCGALQLLKEAGLAPGSPELIEAAGRFDLANDPGQPRAKPVVL